jgi:DNA primase
MHLLRGAPEAVAARDYVVERGLLPHTVEQFQLGYALNQWNGARDFLRSKGHTDDDMLAVGLLVEKQDTGRRYDRFRGRLVIPIRDLRGRVVGFGARALPGKSRSAVEKADVAPKYINSPQTELFDKSTLLYGLDMAKKGIREAGQAVIVEGYMDVMQAHQSGCTNVIAQMGTALTAPQLRQLKRYTNRLILALDADAAGRKATLRGLDTARQTLDRKVEVIFDPRGLVRQESRLQADMRVATLPPGLDPDDLIRSDAAAWTQLIETASPLVEYIINAIVTEVDPNDAKEKSAAVARAMPVIQDVSNAVERDHYTQYLARRLGVDERTLVNMAARPAPRGRGATRPRLRSATAASRGAPPPSGGDTNESTPSPPVPEAQPRARLPSLHSPKELYCLNQIMTVPHIWRHVNRTLLEHKLRPICAQDFADPQNHAIFLAVQELEPPDYSDEADTIHQLQDSLDQALHSRLRAIQAQHTPNPNIPSEGIVSDPVPPEKITRYLAFTVLKMRVEEIERSKSESNGALAEALSQDDRAAIGTYTQQVLELERRRLRIDQALALISYALPSDHARQR